MLAKGYLYEMTIKLYNYEQEISRLRSSPLTNEQQYQNTESKPKFL